MDRGPSQTPADDRHARVARYVAAAAALVSLGVLLPGLGLDAFVSGRERALLDRIDAAAGLPLDALDTSAWLPDALVSRCVSVFGAPWGLRLPGVFAAAFLVSACAWLATRIWRDPWLGAAAGAMTLSCPTLMYSARVAIPDFLGSCGVVAAVVFVYAASPPSEGAEPTPNTPSPRTVAALLGGSCVAILFAIACVGVVLGGVLPLIVAAAIARRPPLRRVLLIGATLLGCLGAVLAYRQGDGFIPALAASKSLALLDQPSRRPIAAVLVEQLHGSFPWVPLALAGALALPTARAWIGLWWLAGLVVYSVWTALYGPCPLALEVPMALSAAACLRACARGNEGPRARGLLVVIVVVSTLVLLSDLSRAPYYALIPAFDRPPWIGEVTAPDLLMRSQTWIGRATLLAFGLLLLVPQRTRAAAGRFTMGGWCLLGLSAAAVWVHGPLEHARVMRSLSPAVDRFTAMVEDGQVNPTLATHRVFDRALRVALRDRDVATRQLEMRSKAESWIHSELPRAMLIAVSDVPALYGTTDRARHPIYVLDRTHPRVWLVSNVRPDGMRDLSPIPDVLVDAPPGTGTPCAVQFNDGLELVEWELLGEPRLGATITLRLVFRALKRMPRSAKVVARLKRGRISRIHERPEPFLQETYPPNFWRYGDILIHETEIELSPLVAFAGTHDLIVTVYERDKHPLSAAERGGRGEVVPPTPGDLAGDVDRESGDRPPGALKIIGSKKEKVFLGQVEVLPRL